MNRSIESNTHRGSLTLESVIILPFIIMLILLFAWKISIIRTDMLFKSSVLKETEKACLYGILYEYSDLLYQELSDEEIDKTTEDFVFANLYELLFTKAFDNQYSSFVCRNRIAGSYINEYAFFVEKDLFDVHMMLTARYDIITPFGTSTRFFTVPLRIWCRGDGSGKVIDKSNNSVWNLDNFKRGEFFRKRYGGNLPFGFPVLSGFRENTALVIKSMDLNRKKWILSENVFDKMKYEIQTLANYSGNFLPWGENQIFIKRSDIHTRVIKFIFPENINMEHVRLEFENLIHYGDNLGVGVELIFYQNSPPPE